MKKGYTVAIIPARSGSKGVINKNIKLLSGKPLLAYSILSARDSKNIDKIFVSTDSPKYADIAREYGIEVPFLRPAEISGDKSTDYQCIKHLLDWLKENHQDTPEFIVHLRPTTPFRKATLIDQAIELLKNTPEVNALRSVHEMSESAYKCLEIKNNLLKPLGVESFDMEIANLPRQHFKKTYKGNGYVDVLKTSFILKNGKIHGEKVIPFITDFAPEVDTLDNFKYLEFLIARGNSKGN